MPSHRSFPRRRCCGLCVLLIALISCSGAYAQTATLQFGGDVLIHQLLLDDAYDAETDTYDFSHMLADVSGLLADTELTVLNLEVPIAAGYYSGYPTFNSPPALLDALKDTGVDVLLCANNHALDRLGRGARQTIERIEAIGLAHIGTARNRDEFNAVPMFDLNGIKVALFNYTQHTNGMEKNDTAENLRYAVHYFGVERAQRDVQAAREAGADYVILSVHWGREYERLPTEGVRTWAQELADAGADLIIGGHPHVLQPYEILTGNDGVETVVLYSMGNFLSGQREQYRDTGALFRFTLRKDAASGITRLESYGYIPTWVWLDEGIGRYRVLALEEALENLPEGITPELYARMQEAWEETVNHLGGQHVISPFTTETVFDLQQWESEATSPWRNVHLDGAS